MKYMGIHCIQFRNNRRHLRLLSRCGRGLRSSRKLHIASCQFAFVADVSWVCVCLAFKNHDAQEGRTPWSSVTVRRL